MAASAGRDDDPRLHASPKTRLPRATRFTVTIDETARLSGRRLAALSLHVHDADRAAPGGGLYRRGGRYDRPVVVLLRFNHGERGDRGEHLALAYRPHPWSVPRSRGRPSRLQAIDPQATASFDAR